MGEVTRWQAGDGYGIADGQVVKHAEGEFVAYADYAGLVAERDELLRRVIALETRFKDEGEVAKLLGTSWVPAAERDALVAERDGLREQLAVAERRVEAWQANAEGMANDMAELAVRDLRERLAVTERSRDGWKEDARLSARNEARAVALVAQMANTKCPTCVAVQKRLDEAREAKCAFAAALPGTSERYAAAARLDRALSEAHSQRSVEHADATAPCDTQGNAGYAMWGEEPGSQLRVRQSPRGTQIVVMAGSGEYIVTLADYRVRRLIEVLGEMVAPLKNAHNEPHETTRIVSDEPCYTPSDVAFDAEWRTVTLCCSEHERLWTRLADVAFAARKVAAETRDVRLLRTLARLDQEATDAE